MSDLNSPDETKSTSGTETNPSGDQHKPVSPARSEAAVTQGTGPGKVGDHDFSTIGWNGAEPLALDGLSPMSKDSHERMLSEMASGQNDGAGCADPAGIGQMKDTYDSATDWNSATGITDSVRDELFSRNGEKKVRGDSDNDEDFDDLEGEHEGER